MNQYNSLDVFKRRHFSNFINFDTEGQIQQAEWNFEDEKATAEINMELDDGTQISFTLTYDPVMLSFQIVNNSDDDVISVKPKEERFPIGLGKGERVPFEMNSILNLGNQSYDVSLEGLPTKTLTLRRRFD